MATRDIRSNLLPQMAFTANISSDTTTNGAIIDTADYDGGIMYTFMAINLSDGTYTPVLEESDDSGMAGANDVADINLIGTEAGAILTANSASGANLASFGAFGTKRFLRLKQVSTGTSTGSDILVTIHKMGDVIPDNALSA